MEESEPRFNSQPEAAEEQPTTDSHKTNIQESPEEENMEKDLESQTQRQEVQGSDSYQINIPESPEEEITEEVPLVESHTQREEVPATDSHQTGVLQSPENIPGVQVDLKNATDGVLPRMRAALISNREMASDYYDKIKSGLQETDAVDLFFSCIRDNLFVVCLKIMEDFPGLQFESKRTADKNMETSLHILVRRPKSLFASEAHGERKPIHFCYYLRTSTLNVEEQDFLALLNILLDRVSKRKLDDIKELVRRPSNLMIEAAELGNYEFLSKVIHLIPELIWERDTNNHTIFHIAIIKRRIDIFNLVYEMESVKSQLQLYEDEKGNSVLHLVANLSSSSVLNRSSGEYAQVKEEIFWFKEIEKFVCPAQRLKQNVEKKTPRDVFFEKHKTLIEAGTKEIKRKAASYLTLATLVLSLIYSAVVSRAEQLQIGSVSSDGNDNPNAHLLETILLVTNAIAMCFSVTSIGAFMSILMSPYQVEDFLQSLPFRFSVGLISLFITVISFITSFCVTVVLAYST